MGQSPTAKELAEAGTWYQYVKFPNGLEVGVWATERKYQALVDGLDLKGRRVLDAGCMAGVGTLTLERLGAKVTGLDPSPAAVLQYPLVQRAFDMEAVLVRVDLFNVATYLGGAPGRAPINSKWDIVVAAGVYYHTPHSLMAIDRAWDLTRDVLVLEGEVWVPQGPAARVQAHCSENLGWDLMLVRSHGPERHPRHNFCVPTLPVLTGWVESLPAVADYEVTHPFDGDPRRATVRVYREH